jgi:hypothetical protein
MLFYSGVHFEALELDLIVLKGLVYVLRSKRIAIRAQCTINICIMHCPGQSSSCRRQDQLDQRRFIGTGADRRIAQYYFIRVL